MRQIWMDKRTPSALIRAARHYEAAAQICIRKTVISVEQWINVVHSNNSSSSVSPEWCGYEAAARIDVSGGWSDTPPITYEFGGSVLNVAIKINGKKPIGAKCRRTEQLRIVALLASDNEDTLVEFNTVTDLHCYSNPQAAGSLVAAVLVFAKVVNTHSDLSLSAQLLQSVGSGIEIQCRSDLPHGSGLGTSSILAGALLASVWKLLNFSFTIDDLLHAVLCVEQLLTSGGGWQDQVGGLAPGVKIGRFNCRLSVPKIEVEYISLTEEQKKFFNDRLLLVYTGRTRLAKNLLQEVIRNWYARKSDIVETVTALVATAEKCGKAFQLGDWECVGDCMKVYWSQKCRMAPGCEPTVVRSLLDELYTDQLIYAGWLAGAGGGGFLYLFTKEPNCQTQVERILHSNQMYRKMVIYQVEIDSEPLLLMSVNKSQ